MRVLLLPKIKSGSQAHYFDRINIHFKVPRVDYEKLSGDRMEDALESLRVRVQAARDIQQRRFSNNGSSDIICKADLHIREIR